MTTALMRTRAELGRAARATEAAWSVRETALLAAFVVAALAPLVAGSVLDVHRLAGGLYVALAAVGLSYSVGLAGMPSLAQGAFMAIGAFGAALLLRQGWPMPAAMITATAAAAAIGAAIAIGVVRLRPVFVAVATWVFAWLVALALGAFPALSGGAQGLVVPRIGSSTAHYEVALALVALGMAAFAVVAPSAAGLALSAARQRPSAAAALGVPAARLRLGAFTASATVGGLAGTLAVQLEGVADPSAFGAFLSLELLLVVVIGGARHPLGPLAGVLVFALLGSAGGRIGELEGLPVERFRPMFAALLVFLVISTGSAGLVPWVAARLGLWRPASRFEALPPPPVRGAVLRVEGLAKRFGGMQALNEFDLALEPGTITALIGPNGSGKTTVLRLIAGSMAPDQGRIALDGRVLGSGLRERVILGIVRTLQPTTAFPEATALENVLVGAGLRRRKADVPRTLAATPQARAEAAATRARALALLDRIGLAGAASTLASELPSWEQRLLTIATALATQPSVLMLDEPAAGASQSELDRLAGLLRSLRADGLAILLVEHNQRLVNAVADHVVVLDAGRRIAIGRPDEIAANGAVVSAYLARSAGS